MRGAALLRAHLDDAIVAAGGVDHDAALADGQRERFFDVDVLARLARHDRRQRVPVIGRADDYRVDVLAIEHPAKVAAGEIRHLVEVLVDALGRLADLLVVHVAERDALRAKPQGVAQIACALTAAADESYTDASVGAGDAVLRCGALRADAARRRDRATGDAGGGVLEKRPAGGRLHRNLRSDYTARAVECVFLHDRQSLDENHQNRDVAPRAAPGR